MNAEDILNAISTEELLKSVNRALKKSSVHSFFSPSGAYRWLNCPGSEHRIMEDLHPPGEDNEYSFEGTILHNLAELLLKSYIAGARVKSKVVFGLIGEKFKSGNLEITLEHAALDKMLEYVDYCIELHQANPGTTMRVEGHTIQIGLPTGSVDNVIFSENYLHITDFKSGFVDVGPEDNVQLISYGLGIYKSMLLPGVKEVFLTIHQDGYPKTTSISVEDLLLWEKKFARAQVSKFFRPGEWCYKNYCPYIYSCGQFADWVCEGMELLVVDERNWVDLIPQAKAGAKFGEAVNSQLYKHLINGGEMEGYELGKRKKPLGWVERDDLKEVLEKRLGEGNVTKPETLITVAQAKSFIKQGIKENTIDKEVTVDDLTVDNGFSFTIKESKEGIQKKTVNQMYFEELAAKFSKEKK